MVSETKLPSKIYLIDPLDDDGTPVKNTGEVCWCADPAGDVNVAYIAEALVAAALRELRARIAAESVSLTPENAAGYSRDIADAENATVELALQHVDATIAALLE